MGSSWLASILIALLLLVSVTTGLSASRNEVFVGYTEALPCEDELGEDICSAYKHSNMCDTGENWDLQTDPQPSAKAPAARPLLKEALRS